MVLLVGVLRLAPGLLPLDHISLILLQEHIVEEGLDLLLQRMPALQHFINALNAMVQVLLDALIAIPQIHADAPTHGELDHAGIQRDAVDVPNPPVNGTLHLQDVKEQKMRAA